MQVRNIYPELSGRRKRYYRIRPYVRWLFVIAGITCLFINSITKGKWWSMVVVWSLITAWNMLFSLDIFEMNIIRTTVKCLFYTTVLLYLIDWLLIGGWAAFVVPIVLFGGLIFIISVFFTDPKEQIQNSPVVLWIVLFGFIQFGYRYMYHRERMWPTYVLLGMSILMILLLLIWHRGFLREIRKRLHLHR